MARPPKSFGCDAAYWSHDDQHSSLEHASQEVVHREIGSEILHSALKGYNGCLFAYGQTGSGKTYSLLGDEDHLGVIPRTVSELFAEKAQLESNPEKQLRIWVSYLEIYNDHLFDLLDVERGDDRAAREEGSVSPSRRRGSEEEAARRLRCIEEKFAFAARRRQSLGFAAEDSECESPTQKSKLIASSDDFRDGQHLSIRDHPKFGICVPGLTEVPVESPDEVQQLLAFGSRRRAVAATAMNDHSSRSHVVFMIKLQSLEGARPEVGERDERSELHSKINLVDLAGAERQLKSQSEGTTTRQGCAINKGLSALSLVIKELSTRQGKRNATVKEARGGVPFRASKLTWVLKDSLAGNSKTHMLANISPASENFAETLSTLRFAASVKNMKTVPTQNRCSPDELIANLRSELDALRARVPSDHQPLQQEVQLLERERLLADLTRDYRGEVEKTKTLQETRAEVLRAMADTAMVVDKMTPYLLNMATCQSLAGCLLYYLPEGRRKLGCAADNAIQLSGLGIPDYLCEIVNEDNLVLTIEKSSEEGRVSINGIALEVGAPQALQDGQRISVGRSLCMRLNMPAMHPNLLPRQDTALLVQCLEEEVHAVENSPSWHALQDYLAQVLDEMPEQEAQELCTEVKTAVRICAEATEITAAVRPDIQVQFDVRLTSGSPTSVVVCVLAHGHLEPICYWNLAQVSERVERMRDCYQVFQRTGSCDLDLLDDPWTEAHPADIWERVRALESMLEDARIHNQELTRRRSKAVAWGVLLWKGTQSDHVLRIVFAGWLSSTPKLAGRRAGFRLAVTRNGATAAQRNGSSPTPGKAAGVGAARKGPGDARARSLSRNGKSKCQGAKASHIGEVLAGLHSGGSEEAVAVSDPWRAVRSAEPSPGGNRRASPERQRHSVAGALRAQIAQLKSEIADTLSRSTQQQQLGEEQPSSDQADDLPTTKRSPPGGESPTKSPGKATLYRQGIPLLPERLSTLLANADGSSLMVPEGECDTPKFKRCSSMFLPLSGSVSLQGSGHASPELPHKSMLYAAPWRTTTTTTAAAPMPMGTFLRASKGSGMVRARSASPVVRCDNGMVLYSARRTVPVVCRTRTCSPGAHRLLVAAPPSGADPHRSPRQVIRVPSVPAFVKMSSVRAAAPGLAARSAEVMAESGSGMRSPSLSSPVRRVQVTAQPQVPPQSPLQLPVGQTLSYSPAPPRSPCYSPAPSYSPSPSPKSPMCTPKAGARTIHFPADPHAQTSFTTTLEAPAPQGRTTMYMTRSPRHNQVMALSPSKASSPNRSPMGSASLGPAFLGAGSVSSMTPPVGSAGAQGSASLGAMPSTPSMSPMGSASLGSAVSEVSLGSPTRHGAPRLDATSSLSSPERRRAAEADRDQLREQLSTPVLRSQRSSLKGRQSLSGIHSLR